MSATVLPEIKKFIESVLQEDPETYFDKKVILEVERLDRALANSRSLAAQRKLEMHAELYARDPDECRKLPTPTLLASLTERELPEIECPVCRVPLIAYWDWEPDYDVEGSTGPAYVVGVYPDVKLLFCHNCHFVIEGRDVSPYISDELIDEIREEGENDLRMRDDF